MITSSVHFNKSLKIKDPIFLEIFLEDIFLIIITSKPVRTIKQEVMYFHTFIDAAGDWLDTVFFPDPTKYYNVKGYGFYEMHGKVIEEFGVFIVDVHQCKKVGMKRRV
jgi:DNA polymerase-3 subunit alpha